MKDVGQLSPAPLLDGERSTLDRAFDLLKGDRPNPIQATMALLKAEGLTLGGAEAQPLLAELLVDVLDDLEADALAPEALSFFDGLDPATADLASNMLYFANFPDGQGELKALSDATVLCMAHLLGASGQPENGCDLLTKAAQSRHNPRFAAAVHATRCHLLGIDSAISALWPSRLKVTVDPENPAGSVDARPLDVAAHRAFARHLAEQARWREAIEALAVAIALPIDRASKEGIGADFAVLVAFLQAVGFGGIPTICGGIAPALHAYPAVAQEALDCLERGLTGPAAASVEAHHLAGARAYFAPFVEQSVPAYPVRRDRPHVDIVWLEITNYCNQKCTFCPDMHREDSRQWQPFDQIKRTIDDLAENVSVGSMQLNAYGEPLLHPDIDRILAYLREKEVPWPTYFTTHGMTLVDKKLKQLSHNYPQGIAVSLHNDSQESYAATRSAKIGDYDTLVSRVTGLLEQMVTDGAATHMRLYQMVCNGAEDPNVAAETRGAFPDTVERMLTHVRKWEAIAASIAQNAPAERRAQAEVNSREIVEKAFSKASHHDGVHLPILRWHDEAGQEQQAFMSPRPVSTYANLLLEYDKGWDVKRKLINKTRCGFTLAPSLAIFATGKLGICCMDMNSTATFGELSDFANLRAALESPQARKIFAELSNGIATSRGCQICLASDEQLCRTAA